MKLDFDNTETYELLLAVCSQHKIDPSSSLDSEKFFRNLLAQYNGTLDENKIVDWLNQQIVTGLLLLTNAQIGYKVANGILLMAFQQFSQVRLMCQLKTMESLQIFSTMTHQFMFFFPNKKTQLLSYNSIKVLFLRIFCKWTFSPHPSSLV